MTVQKDLLLNVESKQMRLAVLKQGKLEDLIIERKKNEQLTGNIYRGQVTSILRNIQSAFIRINESENGFIHISDILENTQKFREMYDMDFETAAAKKSQKKTAENDISKLLAIDQPVLVQVVKEAMGSKGARLTSNISIPGRYLVLLPNTPLRGVSRKVQDKHVSERLKQAISAFEMPQDMGLICRTASTTASLEMLIEEAHELLEIWRGIIDGFHQATGPVCLYRESDLIKKAILLAIDSKFDRLLIDDFKTFQICKKLYHRFKKEHPLSVELYRDRTPMFERFAVEREIDRALRKKIWLPSGGYLFFEKTEAMVTIDVNSGRSTTGEHIGNVEETLVRINMEAAEEIARQLRIRNIGGLIICDFIDMRLRKNQRRVLDKLKECMQGDGAKCTILGMSEFGLVEMTRQRSRESIYQSILTHCPYCDGKGTIKNYESIAIEIERALRKICAGGTYERVELIVHPQVDSYLTRSDKEDLIKIAAKQKMKLTFDSNDAFHLNDFQFYSMTDGTEILI